MHSSSGPRGNWELSEETTLFDKIMSAIAANVWLSVGIAVVAFILFIIHPVLGLIALGGGVAVLWAVGGDDEDDLDGFKVDDSEGMKLPPSGDPK